ncbi:metal ABC transporter ATP-binding protein [Nocardiopsis coralliicola]
MTRPYETSAVEARGVTVAYGATTALDHVDLTVAPGRICGLLGANGAGKSTLFATLIGLIRPRAGHVRLAGRSIDHARAAGLVAYVPQSERIDPDFPLRVADVAMMGRYGRMGPLRRPRSADRAAVEAALHRTGLSDLADRRIGALSGGQRKRAFLARGLAQKAEVFLLDEPFAGVDRASEAAVADVLRAMRDDGAGLLVSTHDFAQAADLCDDAVLLQQRVLAAGPAADVLTPEQLAAAFGLPGAHPPQRPGATAPAEGA